MLNLTRKTDYALVALAYLSRLATDGGRTASAREIADQSHLPLPKLMNILKELARAKLVNSTRGSAGGYSLASEPQSITLVEILTALEGPIRFTNCCGSDLPVLGQAACDRAEHCTIQNPIHKLHDRLSDFLHSVTLADLVEDSTAITVGAS
jgi:FeS assembly SUF system regulator